MRKKQKTQLIFFGGLLIFIVLLGFFMQGDKKFFVVEESCVPAGCPNEQYIDKGVKCILESGSFVCRRECYRPSGCHGPWTNYNSEEGGTIKNLEGFDIAGPSVTTNPNYCYFVKSTSILSVSNWYEKPSIFNSEAKSVLLINSIKKGEQKLDTIKEDSVCSTSNPSLSFDFINIGRGDTDRIETSARYYSYKDDKCSSGASNTFIDGTLTTFLYWKTSPYQTANTRTTTCYAGDVECMADSDCGQNFRAGYPFCSQGNLYQKEVNYSCVNYQCVSKTSDVLHETCNYYGCLDKTCLYPECETGQEKCDGTKSYLCSNQRWVEVGRVIGKCGVDCLNRVNQICNDGSIIPIEKCENYKIIRTGYVCPNGYKIENGICVHVEEGSVYSTLEQCEVSLLNPGYIIQNDQCVSVSSGGVYDTLEECKQILSNRNGTSNIFLIFGLVIIGAVVLLTLFVLIKRGMRR